MQTSTDEFGPQGSLSVPYEALRDTLAALRESGHTCIITGQFLSPGQMIEVHYFTPTPPTPLTLRQRVQRRWWRLLDLWPLQWKRRDDGDDSD